VLDRRSEMMRRGRRAPARETMSAWRCTRARGARDDARVTRQCAGSSIRDDETRKTRSSEGDDERAAMHACAWSRG